MIYQDIYHCICQNTKKWRCTIQYVKPTAQLVFKNRFPKGGPTCKRQVVNPRHQTSLGQSVAKHETPLQVQGQKRPERWGIVEYLTPRINVLFKTNAKSHKHPGIKLLSTESKTQLVYQGRAYILYIYIYINRASGRELGSSGGNTSSNPQVSAPVPRPVVNGMGRMCQRHGSDQTHTLLFESIVCNSISTVVQFIRLP